MMERSHRSKLNQPFKTHLKGKKLICLDIADNFDSMQPQLIRLLEQKVDKFLR